MASIDGEEICLTGRECKILNVFIEDGITNDKKIAQDLYKLFMKLGKASYIRKEKNKEENQ